MPESFTPAQLRERADFYADGDSDSTTAAMLRAGADALEREDGIRKWLRHWDRKFGNGCGLFLEKPTALAVEAQLIHLRLLPERNDV